MIKILINNCIFSDFTENFVVTKIWDTWGEMTFFRNFCRISLNESFIFVIDNLQKNVSSLNISLFAAFLKY